MRVTATTATSTRSVCRTRPRIDRASGGVRPARLESPRNVSSLPGELRARNTSMRPLPAVDVVARPNSPRSHGGRIARGVHRAFTRQPSQNSRHSRRVLHPNRLDGIRRLQNSAGIADVVERAIASGTVSSPAPICRQGRSLRPCPAGVSPAGSPPNLWGGALEADAEGRHVMRRATGARHVTQRDQPAAARGVYRCPRRDHDA